jgi:hypothetical protein
LIDWMMHLRTDLEQRFHVEMAEFEEKMNMPYVTSVKRLAKAEGGAGVLLRPLRRVCGPLPEDVEGRIRSLSYPDLEALGEELLAFRALDDLRAWLDAHVSKSAE